MAMMLALLLPLLLCIVNALRETQGLEGHSLWSHCRSAKMTGQTFFLKGDLGGTLKLQDCKAGWLIWWLFGWLYGRFITWLVLGRLAMADFVGRIKLDKAGMNNGSAIINQCGQLRNIKEYLQFNLRIASYCVFGKYPG